MRMVRSSMPAASRFDRSGFQAIWKTWAGFESRASTRPSSDSAARTYTEPLRIGRDRQPGAIGIVRHRSGAAETRGPAPQLASIREVDEDDRAVAKSESEPSAVGVERPGRGVAPREVGLGEDQSARRQVPHLEPVVLIPGFHRQITAVGAEAADRPVDSVWDAGKLEQDAVVGDASDNHGPVVALDRVALEAGIDGKAAPQWIGERMLPGDPRIRQAHRGDGLVAKVKRAQPSLKPTVAARRMARAMASSVPNR